jgi:hypothetical protein
MVDNYTHIKEFIPPTDSSTDTLCQLNSDHPQPSQKA